MQLQETQKKISELRSLEFPSQTEYEAAKQEISSLKTQLNEDTNNFLVLSQAVRFPYPYSDKVPLGFSDLVKKMKISTQQLQIYTAETKKKIEDKQIEKKRILAELEILFSKQKYIEQQIESIHFSVSKIEKHNQELREKINKLEKSIEEKTMKKKRMVDSLLAEEEFIELIGKNGFLGFIFDEILQEISEETNSFLSQIPNVNFLTIQFVSETFTQKGVSKKNIKPVFFTHGMELLSWQHFSGGQITSIDLAIDLALNKVISSRIENAPGWLILDEVFEGQDLVTKEACLEIIKEFSKDKLVLVIDHASEFKEMFEKKIVIASKQGRSYLESV